MGGSEPIHSWHRLNYTDCKYICTAVLENAVPCGVLVAKGEDVGSPLCHAALYIGHNEVQASLGLVQGELNVDFQHLHL